MRSDDPNKNQIMPVEEQTDDLRKGTLSIARSGEVRNTIWRVVEHRPDLQTAPQSTRDTWTKINDKISKAHDVLMQTQQNGQAAFDQLKSILVKLDKISKSLQYNLDIIYVGTELDELEKSLKNLSASVESLRRVATTGNNKELDQVKSLLDDWFKNEDPAGQSIKITYAKIGELRDLRRKLEDSRLKIFDDYYEATVKLAEQQGLLSFHKMKDEDLQARKKEIQERIKLLQAEQQRMNANNEEERKRLADVADQLRFSYQQQMRNSAQEYEDRKARFEQQRQEQISQMNNTLGGLSNQLSNVRNK